MDLKVDVTCCQDGPFMRDIIQGLYIRPEGGGVGVVIQLFCNSNDESPYGYHYDWVRVGDVGRRALLMGISWDYCAVQGIMWCYDGVHGMPGARLGNTGHWARCLIARRNIGTACFWRPEGAAQTGLH